MALPGSKEIEMTTTLLLLLALAALVSTIKTPLEA